MISGAMPKWRRWFHNLAFGFMCLAFTGIGFIALRGLFPSADRSRGLLVASSLMMGMVIFNISGLLRFRRRTFAEISLDGHALRFRTLGSRQMELLDLS